MTVVPRRLASLFLFCALTSRIFAGGSGLNVVVVVNQSSTNSVQLGNYYCEARKVPPQNVLRISWDTANGIYNWDVSVFNSLLYTPLTQMLSSRQLTNQIDYVLLSMDIPYQVSSATDGYNSTTAALYYGFKPDPNPPCSMAVGSTSAYAGSEGIFRATPPISASSNSFLVTMITSSNLALAKQIVDSGAYSDATFPTQTVFLAKSTDVARNVRYLIFDNALFDTRLRGNYSMQRIDSSSISGLGSILGAETGSYSYDISGVTFAPGALVDNLTSYGGLILADNSFQLSILSLLAAGAAGSYGTVTEPCNYLEKFPSSLNYFYQARGFTLAESYYLSVTNPYQGLIIGDPLAAPFAQPPNASWSGLPALSLLSGTTNLTINCSSASTAQKLQQVHLFLDGTWMQTVTNIAPGTSNLLTVKINGQSINYFVASNSTIQSAVTGLTAVLNTTANTNATKAVAYANGDRIELQGIDRSKHGNQLALSTSNSVGAGTAATTFISATGTNFLDTIAYGYRNFLLDTTTTNQPPLGPWLTMTVTKTNGAVVSVSITNTSSGTTVASMVSALVNGINAEPLLTSSDGCIAEDYVDYAAVEGDASDHRAEFNLRPRSAGWDPAQLQAVLTSSSSSVFTITPTGPQLLDQNRGDLQPRAHLYVTAGVTNLPMTIAFNSTTQADGFHELTAVVYEGSHVRTQKRVSQQIQIKNSNLSAAFSTLVGDSNTAVEATLQFSVVANTNNISRIELFSTGGSFAFVSGVSNAVFAVAGTNLGIGLHPFYAVVTGTNGMQYRTETKWIRLVGSDTPFRVNIAAPPAKLTWRATAGRSYQVLSTTNLSNAFQLNATITASNAAGQWIDTNSNPRRFYRVRTSN